MERFVLNYTKFLESISTILPEKEKKPSLPENDEDKIHFFVRNWYPHMKETSNGNIDYFISNNIDPNVFENLTFLELIKNANNTNKNIIWEYLHTLYALSISSDVVKTHFSNYEENENDSDEEKTLLASIKKSIDMFPEFVSNMVTWRREHKEEKDSSSSSGENPNVENFMENSKLAKLAKEISNEINPDDIANLEKDMKGMDNPMKMMQSLMSGDSNNGVGKIVNTVCDKLKNKMDNGDFNQEDLMGEAMSLMKQMGSGVSGENKNDMDLSSMMNMMKNISSLGDFFGGDNSSQNRTRKIKRRLEKKLKK